LLPGTYDFTVQAAMPKSVMHSALALGREQLLNTINEQTRVDLFIGGDMGIGNTTSASAIYSICLNLEPSLSVGPGTGIDQSGIERKSSVIDKAFSLHADLLQQPLGVLQAVGGLEIAALVGAYIAAAQNGIPILIDGFITTAAALLATKINPATRDWMIFAHRSAEPAHIEALKAMNAKPLLDLEMRLGEASGAAAAVPIIQSALALHKQMASFTEAGVSEA
jgi:nicotinate-nucleotide--dimethylbenzimidazole phosphoribosyltransferase